MSRAAKEFIKMRHKNRFGQCFIVCLLILCCVTAVAEALSDWQKQKVLNTTVLIETDIGIGSGFYIDSDLVATGLHLIAGAKSVRAYAYGERDKDIGVAGVTAFDANRNLAILKVNVSGSSLPLSHSDATQSGERVYVVGYSADGSKLFKGRRLTRHKGRDFCKAQMKVPIVIESDGGPVINFRAEAIGISIAGVLKKKFEFQNLNFSFVVPGSSLRNLLRRSGEVRLFSSIKADLDYCTLIARANARIRKAEYLGQDPKVGKLFSKASDDIKSAAKKLAKVKKIPWEDIARVLRALSKL